MQVIDIEQAAVNQPTALALGYFDAFHLGHRMLLRSVVDSPYTPAMFTFAGDLYHALHLGLRSLYTEGERRALAADMGMQYVFTMPADLAHLQMAPQAFLELLLRAHPALIVCGCDFRFGRQAAGDVHLLADFCKVHGIQLRVLPLLVDKNGQKIGTEHIRRAVEQGDMPYVSACLGRHYAVSGVVMHGRSDGARLGFPTANIVMDQTLAAPKTGVYATLVQWDGRLWRAVSNIGPHPTLGDMRTNIETYLLDFAGDLYGHNLTVQLVQRLRDIRCFDSVQQLSSQIQEDCRQAIRILGGTHD